MFIKVLCVLVVFTAVVSANSFASELLKDIFYRQMAKHDFKERLRDNFDMIRNDGGKKEKEEKQDPKEFCVDRENGLYANPVKCDGFIMCSHGTRYPFNCPGQLKYDEETKQCSNKKCEGNGFCSGRDDGDYKHPNECESFITCSNGIAYRKSCPNGLKYSTAHRRCEFPNVAKCKVDPSAEKVCTLDGIIYLPGRFVHKCQASCSCDDKGRFGCVSLCPPTAVSCDLKETVYEPAAGGCTCKRERCIPQ